MTALEADDPVNHPKHYTSHPSGVECITVTEHMGFNVGNAVKYLWRADEKGSALEDLRKAAWYVAREIEKRERDIDSALDKLPAVPTQQPADPPSVASAVRRGGQRGSEAGCYS